MLYVLTDLFNHVFRSGKYPESWAEGLICPIHKSGQKTDPNNYRGISYTIGKVFSAILCDRLIEWTEDNHILPEEQYGFRKHRRAVDCVYFIY